LWFPKKIQEACEGGRAPALWVQLVVQYYYMVYVVKNFIKGELLADHDGHSCIISWMLNFAAGGCHQHTKGT